MSEYTSEDHTFVVCAYKESEFLTECIESLLNQSARSNVIISTSTPNDFISRTASLYGIPLRVNYQTPSISGDWNFAYSQAGTRLITLAHQDDVYLPDYLSTALDLLNRAKEPIIFFSHYGEVFGDEVEYRNLRLNVKKLMLKPMKVFWSCKPVRRALLSFGNPICCPSVMYVDIAHMVFSDEFKLVLDWHKWEELSRMQGSFVYCEKPLLHHRLHPGSETSKGIQDSTRRQEDYIIFRKFWCTPIAKALTRLYTKSEHA